MVFSYCCVLVACLFLMRQLTVQGNWVAWALPCVCSVSSCPCPLTLSVRVFGASCFSDLQFTSCLWSWISICVFTWVDRNVLLFGTLTLPRCPLVIGRAHASWAPPTNVTQRVHSCTPSECLPRSGRCCHALGNPRVCVWVWENGHGRALMKAKQMVGEVCAWPRHPGRTGNLSSTPIDVYRHTYREACDIHFTYNKSKKFPYASL